MIETLPDEYRDPKAGTGDETGAAGIADEASADFRNLPDGHLLDGVGHMMNPASNIRPILV